MRAGMTETDGLRYEASASYSAPSCLLSDGSEAITGGGSMSARVLETLVDDGLARQRLRRSALHRRYLPKTAGSESCLRTRQASPASVATCPIIA